MILNSAGGEPAGEPGLLLTNTAKSKDLTPRPITSRTIEWYVLVSHRVEATARF